MSKLIKIALVLAVITGAMVFLASRAGEQPITKREIPVSDDVLAK